jgi:hypothetical protein
LIYIFFKDYGHLLKACRIPALMTRVLALLTAKMKFAPLWSMFILLVLPFGLSPGLAAFPTWTKHDKIVLTHYFYWYDVHTQFHFLNSDGTDSLTNHPPKNYLSDYSYRQVSWHRRELLDMMAADIDALLAVYWGNDGELFWSQPGLHYLVQALDSLIAEGYTPPKVALFCDTTALKCQNNDVPPDLTTNAGKALFYEMIRDFFRRVPRRHLATIEGRPIVFLYTAAYVGAYDQRTFDYVNERFKADFGVRPFLITEPSWKDIKTDGECAFGTALYGPWHSGRIGSLGPGFNNENVEGSWHGFKSREGGWFFQTGWEEIINRSVNLVVVETWNELHEATEVSASREHGRTYIDLAAENIRRWKKINFKTAPFVWLDFGRDSYLRGLSPASDFPDGIWKIKVLAGRDAACPDLSSSSSYIYLDVNDDFIHSRKNIVWITVEYYDGPAGCWSLNYDGASSPYQATAPVFLQNSGRWKTHTFHLEDAFFSGRLDGADLRLSNEYRTDNQNDFFGRIWISKSPLPDSAPALDRIKDLSVSPNKTILLPVSTQHAGGMTISLSLENKPGFATLNDYGNGTGTIELSPKAKDIQPSPYHIRVMAIETGDFPLADVMTFRLIIKK